MVVKKNEKLALKNVCAIIFVLFAITSAAQTNSDSLYFKTALSVGGNRRTGLFPQNNFSGSFGFELNKANKVIKNNTDYTYSNANGFELANDLKSITLLKKNFSKRNVLAPTALYVFEYSLLYRINNRHSMKLGVTTTPVVNRKQFWFFIGVGYEYTLYNGEIFVNSDRIGSIRRFPIATVYIENKHQLVKDRLTLNYSVLYFQSLEESIDFTLWITPNLDIVISKALAFNIKYDARFRNVHLADLPTFNDILTFGLKVSLNN